MSFSVEIVTDMHKHLYTAELLGTQQSQSEHTIQPLYPILCEDVHFIILSNGEKYMLRDKLDFVMKNM